MSWTPPVVLLCTISHSLTLDVDALASLHKTVLPLSCLFTHIRWRAWFAVMRGGRVCVGGGVVVGV